MRFPGILKQKDTEIQFYSFLFGDRDMSYLNTTTYDI